MRSWKDSKQDWDTTRSRCKKYYSKLTITGKVAFDL